MKEKGKKAVEKDILKGEKISRKEAIKKTGYAAFSAATMMFLLNNPYKANASTSPQTPGDWDDDGWEW